MALIARWDFENNANDTTGSYNGTGTSVTYNSDDPKSGSYYARFTGSPSKVEAAGPNLLSYTAFTVSGWHRLYSSNVTGDIISGGNGSSNLWQLFTLVYNNQLRFYMGKWVNYTSTSVVISHLQGKWFFYTVVDNNGTIDLYINGDYYGSVTNSRAAGTINIVSIGANTVTSTKYYGYADIDDLRVYSTALTAAEIKVLYNSYYPLVSRWKLDGDATDSMGVYNGTATNMTYSAALKATGNYAGYFNGSAYINCGNIDLTDYSNYTVSGWLNVASTADLFSCGKNATESEHVLYIFSGSMYYTIKNASGTQVLSISTSVSSLLGKWFFVTITDNNGSVQMYVNGVSVGSNTYTKFTEATALTFYIGKNSASNNYFTTGYHDDVRFYDTALTAAEVRTLYNSYFTDKIGPMFLM